MRIPRDAKVARHRVALATRFGYIVARRIAITSDENVKIVGFLLDFVK